MTCLADLKRGVILPGDKDDSDSVKVNICDFIEKPKWYDAERFQRGQAFMKSYKYGVLISYLFAIMVGFTVDSLTNALIYTGESVGPAKARKRYMQTLSHLIKWHEGGDIFDPDSAAGSSILKIRRIHHHVRKQMSRESYQEKSHTETDSEQILIQPGKILPMNQFEMALVQSGFIGVILLQPVACGVSASEKELEDYVYFWRVIGWCLGINDDYNMCALNMEIACSISKEIQDEIIVPGLKNQTPHFKLLSTDFVEGMQAIAPGLNQPAVFKYLFPKMGLPPPRVSVLEWIFYLLLVVQGKLCYHFKIFRCALNFLIGHYHEKM